uniref:Uncharacterized protein n=1 Tax=Percolomonas cosmopolitus TaxID=63605 RepID=A0A7S1KKP0_9EUKA
MPLCRSRALSLYVDEALAVIGNRDNGGIDACDLREFSLVLLEPVAGNAAEMVISHEVVVGIRMPERSHFNTNAIGSTNDEALLDELFWRDVLVSLREWLMTRLRPRLHKKIIQYKREKDQNHDEGDHIHSSTDVSNELLWHGEWRIQLKLWDDVLENASKRQYYGNMLHSGTMSGVSRLSGGHGTSQHHQKWVAAEERDGEISSGENHNSDSGRGVVGSNSDMDRSRQGTFDTPTQRLSSETATITTTDNHSLMLSPDLFDEEEDEDIDEIMSSSESDKEDAIMREVGLTNNKIGTTNRGNESGEIGQNVTTTITDLHSHKSTAPNTPRVIVEPIRSRQDPQTKIRLQLYCRRYERDQ